MLSIKATRIGIAMMTIHAPWVNLTEATMMRTTPVVVAPIALSITERRHPGSLVLRQWRTIPAWLKVKAVNTPTTYSWMRRLTSASKIRSRAAATRARVMTPLENTRRSPLLRYWRGVSLCLARMAERRGKSW